MSRKTNYALARQKKSSCVSSGLFAQLAHTNVRCLGIKNITERYLHNFNSAFILTNIPQNPGPVFLLVNTEIYHLTLSQH